LTIQLKAALASQYWSVHQSPGPTWSPARSPDPSMNPRRGGAIYEPTWGKSWGQVPSD
jgi:hypothetical protein